MAHTLGATVLARTSATSNPITRAATLNALDTVIVLSLTVVGSANRTGGSPTWNGVAGSQAANMTQKATVSPEASIEVWYWLSPTITSANIVIPNAAGQNILSALYSARSATGLSQFEDSGGSNGVSAGQFGTSVNNCSTGSIIFCFAAGGWQSLAPTARTGTSLYETDDGSTGGAGQYLVRASGSGSQTMSWTFGTSDDWGAVAVSFNEAVPAPPAELIPRRSRRQAIQPLIRR